MQNVPTPSKESRSAGLDGRIQRLEEEVRAMGSEVRKMRTDLAELKAVNSAILDSQAQVLALWRKMAPVEPTLKADFPIRSLDHLKEVDDLYYSHKFIHICTHTHAYLKIFIIINYYLLRRSFNTFWSQKLISGLLFGVGAIVTIF